MSQDANQYKLEELNGLDDDILKLISGQQEITKDLKIFEAKIAELVTQAPDVVEDKAKLEELQSEALKLELARVKDGLVTVKYKTQVKIFASLVGNDIVEEFPLCASADSQPAWIKYKLRGVVCHQGKSPNEGHYVSFVRSEGNNGVWYHCDVKRVEVAVMIRELSATAEPVQPNVSGSKHYWKEGAHGSPYILLYRRQDNTTLDAHTQPRKDMQEKPEGDMQIEFRITEDVMLPP
ncbi:hypothetical protein DFH07DRAFT_964612 [Mycena maculata]|uniref:USP domain-containing protein n=1 Tax=Mycena maculata TaxID=230809 RepID=A0AAD7N1J1_9AGAR|nr:hypothetical protein DFH07DRAFT_964612 [Mycena maculata]